MWQDENPTTLDPITNTTFFPDVDPNKYRADYRIPAEISDDSIITQLKLAMQFVNRELADYQTTQISNGYAKLEDVPAEKIGDESPFITNYFHAVYCYAKAQSIHACMMILPESADADADNTAENLNYFQAESTRAVAQITGDSLVKVTLI